MSDLLDSHNSFFCFCLEAYDDHMKDHCENEWLCHLCGRKLKTKRNLINHYFVHSGEKPFSCNDCGKVFTCKDKLKLHLKIHKGIRPHVCLVCNKAFIQKGHLASHSKSHVSFSLFSVFFISSKKSRR